MQPAVLQHTKLFCMIEKCPITIQRCPVSHKKTALHVQGGKIFAQGFNLLQTVFSIGIGYWSFGSWMLSVFQDKDGDWFRWIWIISCFSKVRIIGFRWISIWFFGVGFLSVCWYKDGKNNPHQETFSTDLYFPPTKVNYARRKQVSGFPNPG